MIKRTANILDFPKAGLSPEIWSEESTLKPEVKEFILGFIHSFAQANNFKATDQWISEIKFVGSLTTNLWNSNSDVDIHIVVDLSTFVKLERPDLSEKEASDYLDGIRKQVDQVKAKVPTTGHPIEIYFETEFTTKASQEFSGTYSVLQDKWLVAPHIVEKDFDISTLHPDLLNLAKETASELDAAFGEIKRDVQDIKELNETITDWPPEQRDLFEKKLQKRLDELENEIKDLVAIREDVAEKRKHYDAISEQEVRFKYLQKYWYMHVLTDLKTLLKQSPELSTKDIPVVENIMQQANLKEALGRGNSAWISPEGTVFPLKEPTHADWLDKNYKWLHKKYGFTIDNSEGTYDDYDPASFCGLLVAEGWSRVGDIENVSGTGVEVPDMHNIPTAVFDFVLSNLKSPTEKVTFEDSEDNYVTLIQEEIVEGQKAVNRALSHKRLQTAALSKKEAEYLGNLKGWIAPDGAFIPVKPNEVHTDPIWNNEEELKKKYGINIDPYTETGYYGVVNYLLSQGWARVSYDYGSGYGGRFGVEVEDIANIPPHVEDFLSKVAPGIPFIIDSPNKAYIRLETPVEHLQEEANQAYKEQRLFQMAANLKEAQATPEEEHQLIQVLMVDVDDTIFKEAPNGEIGDPIKGAKEVLQKLKDDGYTIVLNSHRANTEEGRQDIKNAMDEWSIPYDEFWMGDKPLAFRYIDDRAVQMTTWKDVLKNIEKAENHKAASLNSKYWIDPSGKEYLVGTRLGHYGWIAKNVFNLDPFIPKNDQQLQQFNDKAEEMLEEGWIRVSSESAGQFSVEVNDLENLPRYLDNFIAQHFDASEAEKGVGIELDDHQGNFVTITDPFPTLQDAVNKKLRPQMSVTPKATLSKKEAQLGSEYDYSSTQFNLPKELSEKIIRWAVESIPEEEIVHDSKDPGTKGIQLESHITLKYGLKTNEFSEVEKVLKGEKSPHIKFGKTSFFEPEGKDYDVIIITVESEDLQNLNKKLCDNIEHEDTTGPEYHPHVTVAYVKKDLGKKFDGKDIITGEELDLDVLMFNPKEGEKRELELVKSNKKEASSAAQYINQLDDLVFEPVSKDVWNTINAEGLNEEHNANDPSQWVMAKISLEASDIEGLKSFNEDVVNKFNQFDIALKDKYNLQFTDLIDYDNGRIIIVKPNTIKESSFMPSNTDLAPSNDWSGDVGWPGNEEMDNVWPRDDGENYYSPKDDRPREKSVWWKLLNMFKKQQPLGKKEVEKDAASFPSKLDTAGIQQYLLDYGKTEWGEMDYSQVKDMVPSGGEWILQDIPLSNFPHWTDFEGMKIKKRNPQPIVTLGPDFDWRVLDGKHRIAVANAVGEKSIKGYVFKDLQQNVLVSKQLSRKEIVPVKEANVEKKATMEGMWIDPNGSVYYIGAEGLIHNEWVLDNLDLLKKWGLPVTSQMIRDSKKYFELINEGEENVDPPTTEGIWDAMFKQGWVRVGDAAAVSENMIELQDLNKIPASLDNIMAENFHEGDIIWVEDRNKRAVKLEYNPTYSLQKAVNKALQQKRLQTSALSKKEAARTVKLWIDPNGKEYPLPASLHHGDWIKQNRELLRKYGIEFKGIDTWDEMLAKGWTRVLTYPSGTMGIEVGDRKNIPAYLDDFIAKYYTPGQRIQLADEGDSRKIDINDPFPTLEQAIHKSNRNPAWASLKTSKQWVTPTEQVNQPGMDWGWADYIYDYVDSIWKSLLAGWLELDPKNYVKPVILIEKIYQDEGRVSAWVHIEFVNTAGNTDAYMKLKIDADIEGEQSIEPEGPEYFEHLTNWQVEVLDYGKSDELEKAGGYGPTNYKGPSVADELYQDSPYRMNVTYSPEEDEELMDQNGKGGYPNRWMSRHRGPYYTNEGKVVKMLEETSAALSKKDIGKKAVSPIQGWLAPDGQFYAVNYSSHADWIKNNKELLMGNYKIGPVVINQGNVGSLLRKGWTRINGYLPNELDFHVADIYNIPQSAEQFVWKHKPEVVIVEDLNGEDTSFDREEYSKGLMKKADISGQTINNILKLIQQNGGATYNLSKGNLVGTNAYAVAIYPDREQILDGVDYDRLEGYLTQNEDLLSNSNNSFGAWVSGNKVYLDVVATVKDKKEAMQLGLKHKQLAIFDLKNLVEIPLQRVASLKTADEEGGYKYWIDPQGKVYDTMGDGEIIWDHQAFVSNEKELLRTKYHSKAYGWEDLIQEGWTRAIIEDNGDVMLQVRSSRNLPTFLNRFVKDYSGMDRPSVMIDAPEGYYTIDPFIGNLHPPKAKQAAAVSDREQQKYYDEIYSDRWRDDSSKIDGGNEYYDWAEGGSNDYPNPKDEEKEHVYMDLLEDPAKANFPAGLPEYWVTFYDANPDQGDQGGI